TLGTGFGTAFVVDGAIVGSVGTYVVADTYRQTLPDGALADDALSARGLLARSAAGEPVTAFGADLGRFLAPIVTRLHADIVVVSGGALASFNQFADAARQ